MRNRIQRLSVAARSATFVLILASLGSVARAQMLAPTQPQAAQPPHPTGSSPHPTLPPSPHGGPAPHAGPGSGQAPHGFHAGAPPQDLSAPSPAVPKGEIVVDVVGASEEPLQGIEVKLHTQFESIAQGKSSSEQSAHSDAEGHVTFRNLEQSLRLSHVVRVEHQGAIYELPAFRMSETSGQRARLHVYPVTRDLKEAFVGLRGFVVVELRDGSFHFDVVYRVINMSRVTWVPSHLHLDLPKDALGVEVGNEGNLPGFKEQSGGVELIGTYPPGQKDVRLQFQVPSRNEAEQAFEIGVPPHLAELRVLAEFIPGLGLSVPGFDAAEPTQGPDGKRILITRRVMQPGQSELDQLRVELSGLPVPGPGRLVACALGLAIAGLGVAQALRMRRGRKAESLEDRAQAKRILLDELVALERAAAQGQVGPKTHEQAKRQLLDALARLEAAEEPAGPSVGATLSTG